MDLHSLLSFAALAAVFALLWYMRRPDIRGENARALVARGARLVDVRSAAEFHGGHLEQARNMPLSELTRRSGELGEKERPILVYCASGARSAAAKRLLKRCGFTHVYNLGAMSNW